MKRFIYLILALSVIFTGCKYDDDDLWNRVDDLDARLKEVEALVLRLNNETEAIKSILGSSKGIVDITENPKGYEITFSDGTSIKLNHGSDGKEGSDGAGAPIVGVKKDSDGLYYWTITKNGTTEWLLNDLGQKMSVTGKAGESGVTPQIGVDGNGYWIVDYGSGPTRILDESGKPIKASGDGGESLFERIDTSDDNFVTFHLANGEVVVVERTDALFAFVDKESVGFNEGEELELKLTVKNIRFAEVLKTPEGWDAELRLNQSTVTITAPLTGGVEEGVVSLIAIDNKGNTLMAALVVEIEKEMGYADPQGTFIVLEGNMTSENGSLAWFDREMTLHKKIFEDANNGMEIGNVVQDIFIHSGNIYILTQNGARYPNSAGRFVVCDAMTMKMKYADELVFLTPEGVATWPQHLVVVSDTKAYVQYSSADMENTSGIIALKLSKDGVQVGKHVEGTYGAFTKEGATKGRMVYSRGKLFAGTGHSLSIINSQSDEVEKKVEFGAQVKGVAKAADGNIYVALAQEYSGSGPNNPGTFVTNTRIVGLDHKGEIVHDNYLPTNVKFPVSTPSPKIQFSASFTEPYLFFSDKNEFYFSSLGRYNYTTGTMDSEFVLTSDIYGYCGVHPYTNELWVPSSSTLNWKTCEMRLFNSSTGAALREYSLSPGFCAGVDFGYRFSSKWINL